MAGQLGRLEVVMGVDNRPFDRGLDNSVRQLNQSVKSIQGSATVLSGALAGAFSLGAVASALNATFEAADRLTAAQEKLAGSARITGQNLEFLRFVSFQIDRDYRVGATAANELTLAVEGLAQRAGRVNDTADAVGRLLDLGAAKGLSAAQALEAFKQAAIGSDEGTEKLFSGAQPSQIQAEYARALGLTATKLTEAQKSAALFQRVMNDGGKVTGAYTDRLQTAAGQTELLRTETEEASAAIGLAFNDIRVAVLPVLAEMAGEVRGLVAELQILGARAAVAVGEVQLGIAKSDVALGGALNTGAKGLQGMRAALNDAVSGLPGPIRDFIDLVGPLGGVVGAAADSVADTTDAGVGAAEANLRRLREAYDSEVAKIRAGLRDPVFGDTTPNVRPQGPDATDPDKQKSAVRALREQVSLLAEGLRLGTLTADEKIRAVALERQLAAAARDTNRALEVRNASASGAASLRDSGLQFDPVISTAGEDALRRYSAALGQTRNDAEDAAESVDRLAESLDNFATAGRGLAAIASGLGLIGDKARRAVDDVLNVVDAVARMRESQDAFGIPSLGATLATGIAGLGAIVSVVSAVGGAIGGLFGGNREWEEAINRNTGALEKASLFYRGFTLDFSTLSGIGEGLDALLAQRGMLENSARGFLGKDTSNRQKNRAEDILDDFGLTLAEVNAAAEQFGIDLYDDKGALILGAVQQLADRIDMASMSVEAFGRTLAGQSQTRDLLREVFDRDDPVSLLQDRYADLLGGLSEAAEVQYGLVGLDLSSVDGQGIFEEALRRLATDFASGALDESMLAGFESVEDFISYLTNADRALDALAENASKAAEQLTNVPPLFDLALRRIEASRAGASAMPTGNPIPRPTAPERRELERPPVRTRDLILNIGNVGGGDDGVREMFTRAARKLEATGEDDAIDLAMLFRRAVGAS